MKDEDVVYFVMVKIVCPVLLFFVILLGFLNLE